MANTQGEKPRLLVVEDDPALAQALALALSRRGFNVAQATNGRTALERATSESSVSYTHLDVYKRQNEWHGLSPALLPAITDGVSIPMAAGVESLNVAIAGALAMYAVAAQQL